MTPLFDALLFVIVKPSNVPLPVIRITFRVLFCASIIVELAKGKKPNYNEYKPILENDIIKDIKKIISKNKGASLNALMGIVMSKYRGKIEGKSVINTLKKYS